MCTIKSRNHSSDESRNLVGGGRGGLKKETNLFYNSREAQLPCFSRSAAHLLCQYNTSGKIG